MKEEILRLALLEKFKSLSMNDKNDVLKFIFSLMKYSRYNP